MGREGGTKRLVWCGVVWWAGGTWERARASVPLKSHLFPFLALCLFCLGVPVVCVFVCVNVSCEWKGLTVFVSNACVCQVGLKV